MVKHGAAEVVGVEGHDYVNGDGGRGVVVFAIARTAIQRL